ncbi:RHS domain-containing protein [Pseudomonas jessenii]|uniref:RHS domain-containing protein n=1 Tax=Pseudomonas jessenii TaxID=77298 RepID=UPI003892A092
MANRPRKIARLKKQSSSGKACGCSRKLHSLYLYTPSSYAPLARIDSDPELPEREASYYFHTDQIGTPQEMTNAEGHVVWRAY